MSIFEDIIQRIPEPEKPDDIPGQVKLIREKINEFIDMMNLATDAMQAAEPPYSDIDSAEGISTDEEMDEELRELF